jgi:hypothetical protein
MGSAVSAGGGAGCESFSGGGSAMATSGAAADSAAAPIGSSADGVFAPLVLAFLIGLGILQSILILLILNFLTAVEIR